MNIKKIIEKIDDLGIYDPKEWSNKELNSLNTNLKGLVHKIKIDVTRNTVKELLGFTVTKKSSIGDKKMYLSRLDQSAETIREHML